MTGTAGEFAALGETVVFLSYFKDLPDPRQPGKVVYPLDEVLLLCLLAMLGGAETFVDIPCLARRSAPSAPVSAVSRRHALARSTRRHFCQARCGKFEHCF
jgi:DDE_Tnp_1-associated